MNAKQYILFFGFIGFIAFPILNNFVPILPDTESSENRRMKPLPAFDTIGLEKIAPSLEGYLNDHISVRNRMISFYNVLNVFVFRSSPVSFKAIVGKDGWYFMSGEEIKTYTGTELFTDNELLDFKNEVLRRKKIIEQKGAKMLFAIVPNKSNVYSEYMPDNVIRSNTQAYGKQLLFYLQQNNVPVIDLYTPLINAKKEHETYYRTDNHWNDFGAFIAANILLNEIRKTNEHVRPLTEKEYPIVKIKDEPGNIAKMFSIEKEVTEYDILPKPLKGFKTTEQRLNKYKAPDNFAFADEFELTRATNKDSLPVVLIIRDSFGKKIFPYIAEECKKCITVFDNWQYGLNETILDGEKPDIIIYLIIESNVKNVLKYRKLELEKKQ